MSNKMDWSCFDIPIEAKFTAVEPLMASKIVFNRVTPALTGMVPGAIFDVYGCIIRRALNRLMTHSQYKKIGIATAIMMTSIFLSRVTGLVREMVLASLAGAGTGVDAFRVAFVLPEILNHILASGFLSVTFIPIFSRYLSKENEPEGWHIFSIILTVFGALLATLIAIAMVWAPQLVPLVTPGRNDPAFMALAVKMTRITLPAQFFFFAGGMLMAVQFAKERFLIPAMAPLIYNVGIIAGGWLLSPWIGVEGFCWGALAGALLGSFTIQWVGALRVGMKFRPTVSLNHADLRHYVLMTLPLMLGLTMVFSTEIFSKFFGSFLPVGAIAWIDYAMRIMLLLVAFFGQAVGVASYPYMAQMAAQGRMNALNQIINKTLSYLALVIPVSILVMVLRHEVVYVLFERGRFTPEDTQMTALALSGLLVGAVAFATQTVVNRGFYATHNTLLPAVYGTLAVVLSLPVYWIGMKMRGVAGVGLAISFSAIIQATVLFVVWNRRSGNEGAGKVYRVYWTVLIAALAMGAVLWPIHKFLVSAIMPSTLSGHLAVIGIVSGSFFAMIGLWGWAFKIEAIHYLYSRITSRHGVSPGK